MLSKEQQKDTKDLKHIDKDIEILPKCFQFVQKVELEFPEINSYNINEVNQKVAETIGETKCFGPFA